jgi:predicted ribosome quality control (RQC) complex YloA/Tae2 family protein
MEKEKEIIKKILLIHDTNKMIKKEDNLDEFAKLLYNYKHNIEENKNKFNQPDDRTDSPHHHNNRLD